MQVIDIFYFYSETLPFARKIVLEDMLREISKTKKDKCAIFSVIGEQFFFKRGSNIGEQEGRRCYKVEGAKSRR